MGVWGLTPNLCSARLGMNPNLCSARLGLTPNLCSARLGLNPNLANFKMGSYQLGLDVLTPTYDLSGWGSAPA